jgi:EAL domain-containing protein (putative c-di-GMP-specific phosphodiesterase class I)
MVKVALLIGVSEYEEALNPLPAAVKDVEAMQRVLKNPELGAFNEVKLLRNPESHEMQYEIETLFSGRTKDDLVLLFFSGHGLKDDNGKLYFATRSTRKHPRGELIRSTAVPASFVHEIMINSRAKRQAIILDCCFSGAFDSSISLKDNNSVDLQNQLGAEGRIVLTSSSAIQYSFEQEGKELSIYTSYLVEGIETGAADKDKDGNISMLEIHDYASSKIKEFNPNLDPKIITLKDKGFEIILSKAAIPTYPKIQATTEKLDFGKFSLEPVKQSGSIKYYSPLHSLLERCEPFIETLVERLKDNQSINRSSQASEVYSIHEAESIILEIIRRSSNADFVFVLHCDYDQKNWTIKSYSNFCENIADKASYIDVLKSKILSGTSVEEIFTSGHRGIYRTHYEEKTETSKVFVLIPLESESIEFVAVCGLERDSYLLNDAYGTIVSSFHKAAIKLFHQPARVEAEILDTLKKNYGFIPIFLYERRFELFCERLNQITIYFEPILDLEDVTISGWEALARDTSTLKAPVDLFYAAELWGRRFTTELDLRLLTKAVENYLKERIRIKQNRSNEILPLSVNVYPESLMRTIYFEEVSRIIGGNRNRTTSERNSLIPSRKLILEISEKAGLPEGSEGILFNSPLEGFKRRLSKYVDELNVKFGIDDFGVGYASVSRLAGLNPPYIKIDREILHYQPADIIIQFVRRLALETNPMNPANIIVEGLDEHSPIKLHHLKKLNIGFVQGYIVGRAEPEIYRLSSEKREFLLQQLDE